MLLVLDNTVLSNFALVEQSTLLAQLSPGRLVTAREAWRELQTGIELGLIPRRNFSWLSVLELTTIEQAQRDELMPPLDIGEAACLALAHARGCALLTDDRLARREARRLGVPLSGTIGALVSLMDDGHLTVHTANQILQQMIAVGYRSPFGSL